MYLFTFFLGAIALHKAHALESYDYIIAGAGPGGLVLANRLSEDASVTVAVIEPGTDQRKNPAVTESRKFGRTNGTDLNWDYVVEKEASGVGRNLSLKAGRGWGGTSLIDDMTYIRGEVASIDAWESLGNEGWTWKTLLPYYKRSENYTKLTAEQAAGAPFHGADGQTGYTPTFKNGSFSASVMGAWKEVGLRHNSELNNGTLKGFGLAPRTLDVDRNIRWDASRAYYLPVEKRPNLKIIQGTVTGIMWAPEVAESFPFGRAEKAVAEAVYFVDENKVPQTLGAQKEVILSAGALRTPLILERSGIGNLRILQSLGISAKIDLPGVGENLVGPTTHQLTYNGTLEQSGDACHTFVDVTDLHGDDTDAAATSSSQSLPEWAKNIVKASGPGSPSLEAVEKLLKVRHDLLFTRKVAVAEIRTAVIHGQPSSQFWNLQPFSRGSVHLSSATVNDADLPVIKPYYYSADFDLTTNIQTAKLVRKFWRSSPIPSHIRGIVPPGVGILPENATDAQWTGYLKSSSGASTRSVGTAAMMSRDLGGVVDPQLKVYGTGNVRVVDASILPLQTHGYITATLYAVAERAADIIKGSV